MWFVDHAKILVKAGDGGRGCAALSQPPYIRYPYPDGGDGGDGGDVIVHADPNIATLLDFHFRHEFKAGRGGHGGSNKKTGRRGEDLVIRLPVGTVIQDAPTGDVLRDLTRAGEQVTIAKGGKGGLGNAAIAASARAAVQRTAKSRRPPRLSQKAGRGRDAAITRPAVANPEDEAAPGELGEARRIRLELKLIADVGIIGVPNAGKSSLLSRISTAHPKVGAYPFTTRYPVLGVVRVDDLRSFVACDIPGLIEGAHMGKGLGIQFLRHIERTRLLVHLIDMAGVDGCDPEEAFRQVDQELAAYSEALARKPQLIVANKMDLPTARTNLKRLARKLKQPIVPISCATRQGISSLVDAIWKALHQ